MKNRKKPQAPRFQVRRRVLRITLLRIKSRVETFDFDPHPPGRRRLLLLVVFALEHGHCNASVHTTETVAGEPSSAVNATVSGVSPRCTEAVPTPAPGQAAADDGIRTQRRMRW